MRETSNVLHLRGVEDWLVESLPPEPSLQLPPGEYDHCMNGLSEGLNCVITIDTSSNMVEGDWLHGKGWYALQTATGETLQYIEK